MINKLTCIILFFVCFSAYAQEMEKYPLSRQDSAIILSNLEKYERELIKEDWKEASRYLNANGLIYWEHNFLDQAVEYYEKSIILNKKVNNASGIAMIYNNLGMIQADLKNHEIALSYFEKTLAARKYQKKKRGMIAALHNIAIELNNLERYNQSILKLDEALMYARELNDPEQLRLCYGMLAETYEKNGDTENSFKYFNLYRTFHEMIQKEQLAESERKVKHAEDQLRISELEQRNQELELQLSQQTINEQEKIIEEKDSANVHLLAQMTKQQMRIKILAQKTELLKREAEIKKLLDKQVTHQKQLLKRKNASQLFTVIMLITSAFAAYFFFKGRKKERRSNLLLKKLNKDIAAKKDEIEDQAEKLKLKNTQLFRLNRFKDGMTGMLVHDMKNPLNVVFHHIKDINDPKPKKAVKNAGRQMMNMIQNLLDVQKFENSKMPLNIETHELDEIIADVVQDIDFLLTKKNIAINVQSKHTFAIKADKDVVTRVLTNLLTNAIKYSPLNESVTISMEEESEVVKVIISDKGPGLEPENQEKIFEMFAQVKPLKSGNIKSSGIGLSFCKLAVESHGHSIGVHSQPGNGSHFWFTLTKTDKTLKKKQNYILNHEEDLLFTIVQMEYLHPFVKQLEQHNIFELTQIRNIIKQIKSIDTTIDEWKNKISEALMSVNEARFKHLLKQASLQGHEN